MQPKERKPFDLVTPIANMLMFLKKQISLYNTPESKINAVIRATNLHNAENELPTFLHKSPTDGGEVLTYKLPPGIIKQDFLDRREHFETFGSFQTEYTCNNSPYLKISTYKNSFPDNIPFTYNYNPKHGLAPLPLGKLPNGKDYIIDLSQMPHMCIGGMTGYGKTSLLLALAVALKQAGCMVIVADHKKLDFPKLADYLTISLHEKDTLKILQSLLIEMERRLNLLSGKAQKIQDYHDEHLPYIVLIVDELTTIDSKEIQTAIHEIAARGRAPGISLILATQKPSAKIWDGFTDTRDLCTARLSFYVSDYFMSQTILGKGNTRACSLPQKPGRAVIAIGDEEHMIQTMFIDANTALTELEKIGKGEMLNVEEQYPIWTPKETGNSQPDTDIWCADNQANSADSFYGEEQGKNCSKGIKRTGKRKKIK